MSDATRGPGRPRGSRTTSGDARAGVPAEFHSMPSMAERLRMIAIELVAERIPQALKAMPDSALEELEDEMEAIFNKALRAEGK